MSLEVRHEIDGNSHVATWSYRAKVPERGRFSIGWTFGIVDERESRAGIPGGIVLRSEMSSSDFGPCR